MIGCKSPSSLGGFMETNANFKKELEEFSKAFERDKVMEL